MSYAGLARKTSDAAGARSTAVPRSSVSGLRIGETNDVYEQEADRLADEVMDGRLAHRHWSLSTLRRGTSLQKKCACGGSGDDCEQCEQTKDDPTLRRKGAGSADTDVAPPIVHEVLNSPGQPLGKATRDYFEPLFGYDFNKVRLHTDGKAAQSAQAINALAYTVGQHMVFASGQYTFKTRGGRDLIAHELVHVAQQGRVGATVPELEGLPIGPVSDPAEQEARELGRGIVGANAFASGLKPNAQPNQLQRQDKGPVASIQPPQVSRIDDPSLYPYVDDFVSVYYDIDYRHEGGNLSKWIRVNYSDGTAIDIHLDRIVGQSMPPEEAKRARDQGRVGEGDRAFPDVMNPVTTPRLWEAKRSAIEAMERYNLEFMTAALPAVFFIITMPLATMGMAKGVRPTATRTTLTRGLTGLKPSDVLDDTLRAALKPNTMRHVFGKAAHALDPLVKELGGEAQVMTQAVRALGKARLPSAGLFEESVLVAGRTVTVRGSVVNGVPRISTLFIKP